MPYEANMHNQHQARAADAHAHAPPFAHTPTRECKAQGHATQSTRAAIKHVRVLPSTHTRTRA
jgi:hypothetical protein